VHREAKDYNSVRYSRRLPRAFLLVLLLATGACGGRARLPAPPVVFPLSTAWIRDLEQPLRPPLASDGERLFLADEEGSLQALSLDTGTPLWRVSTGPARVGASTGLVVARRAQGGLSAHDPARGTVRWTAPEVPRGDLPPLVTEDVVLVVGEGTAALDGKDGKARWKTENPAATSLPALVGTYVLLADAENRVRALDQATGRSRWTQAAGGPVRAVTPDGAGGTAFAGAGRSVVALGLEQGRRRWRWKLGTEIIGAPRLLGDRVIFATFEDVLYGLKAGNGNMVWRTALPTRPVAGPLMLGSAALVLCYGLHPEETLLLAVDGRTGARLGEFRMLGEALGEPLLVGDRLVVSLAGPRLAVFGLGGASAWKQPSLTNPTAGMED
jgi:putative pyrroloquinoline-quinone binding quinoprotein/putative pyrroloquinoline-quinone-binding quinoprotein